MHVAVAAEHDAPEWDAFVSAHRTATGSHSWSWRQVFARAFGHESIYLLTRSEGAIVGVLPLVFINSAIFGRSLVSLPFVNYGGVVAGTPEARGALLESAVEVAHRRRCAHIELRHIDPQYQELPAKQHKVTMKLPLDGVSWDTLDRKVRNQIRKAQKSGLTVERGGPELLADFYRVFARNMRDLGTPVYGRRLFAEVMAAHPATTRVHVVRLDRTCVAAGLTYRSGQTVEVPWASSVRDYNSLCPNHLLYWSVIESAVSEGAGVLDFGRSTPHEGTYKFKEQWGAGPVPLHWEYRLLESATLPNASPTNPKFRLAIQIWKRLPLAIATRVGPAIVRAIP